MKYRFMDTQKRPALGMFSMIPEAAAVEIIGYAGFDFVILDEEHTPFTSRETIQLVRAAECSGMAALVRVPEIREVYIKKALDSGASGIMVPNISNRQMVEEAIALAKFSPEGCRGACPCVRANRYGGGENYYERANGEIAVVALIEGRGGLDNFADILRTPKLDAICLGPVDLSVSLGCGGDTDHPAVEAALEKMIREAKSAGVCTGIFTMSKEAGTRYLSFGADYLVFGTDTTMFYEKCREIRSSF